MRRSITTTMFGFVLALSSLSTPDAAAGVRARVEINERIGPANVRIRLQTPDRVYVHRGGVHGPRHHAPLHVSRYDRKVIYRLSVITGVPERPLLRQRANGMNWKRIARLHGISQRELKIARNPERFARWHARHAWSCGTGYDHFDGKGKGHGKGKKGGRGRR